MIPFIGDSITSPTLVISGVLLLLILTTLKRRTTFDLFPPWLTSEVKGFAILTILFGHIGYFLISDNRFLQPLSNYSGVGVDLFLIVSGFGLTVSALSRPLTLRDFYRRRMFKVLVPVAITVLVFSLGDALFLGRSYPLLLTIKNLFGFFPQADLYRDIDSPLWFITPLLFYYLLLPFFSWRKAPYILPAAYLLLGYILTRNSFLSVLPVTEGVKGLYRIHAFGFGVGSILGVCLYQWGEKISSLMQILWIKKKPLFLFVYMLLLATTAYFLSNALITTHVGEGWRPEQIASLTTSLLVILFFVLVPVRIRILSILGASSFFIYLVHWPIMHRYDFLFVRMQSVYAVLLYAILFAGAPPVFHWVTAKYFVTKNPSP